MSTRSTVLGLAVVGAFFIGRYLAPDASGPGPAAAVAPPARAMVPETTPVTTTIVREVVRPQVAAPGAEVAPDDPSPAVIEERARAVARARTIVDTAIAAKRWTGADAAALLEVLPQLDGDGAAAIMTTLITPINTGHMKLETSGSVLDPT